MSVHRRTLIAAGIGLGATAPLARAAMAEVSSPRPTDATPTVDLIRDSDVDQSAALQAAIDDAASKDRPLFLPPGRFVVSDLRLRSGTRLIGAAGATTLLFAGGDAFITADKADGLMLRDIVLDGRWRHIDVARGRGLVNITRSASITIDGVDIRQSAFSGLVLDAVSGRINASKIKDVLDVGIMSNDAAGLAITANTVSDCGNNAIQVWRSAEGEDGTTITDNRIARVRNVLGGSGEYGNGINVFRANRVLVSGNHISDCAYTAIRGNAASNIQIVANTCARLGEVAIYAEFGFEGCIISNNVIDHAAQGISVTNFNDGGRLAVINGNLIRNLFRRDHEPVDKRGIGIGVEADATVSGNTIETAPTVGIQIGWGRYMRNVSATGNMIRDARVGISVSRDSDTGMCLLANNLIAGARDGAIRQMRFGAVFGPDLALGGTATLPITATGNVAA